MTRPVPFCHRTIGPRIADAVYPAFRPEPCLGSACSACVRAPRPECMDMETFHRLRLVRCGLPTGGDADPWPDPAREEKP